MLSFKKIYIEITNACNLNCPFCIKTKRKLEYMSLNDFQIILEKIKGYTEYIYLHVMGEPLTHPKINDFLNIASKYYKINITTNGLLLSKIKENKNIRQINISIHNQKNDLKKLFEISDYLLNNTNTIINYRLWIENNNDILIKEINNYYNTDITKIKKHTIKKNLYVDFGKEFIWPTLNNEINNEYGTCKGTIDHIAILVDGTIVPCCLDSNGVINLGNIFDNSLEEVINSNKFQEIYTGFKSNKKVEPLCKKCNFYQEKNI